MNQQKKRTPIAAILLLVSSIFSLFTQIINIITISNSMVNLPVSSYIISFLLIAINIFFAVVLLSKKGGMITTIAAGALVVIRLFDLISSFGNLIGMLQCFLSLATAVLITLMTLDNLASMKKLWFVPGILVSLNQILFVINMVNIYTSQGAPIAMAVSSVIVSAIGSILPILIFFLLGKWLADPYVKQVNVPYRAPAYPQGQPQYQQPQYQQPQYQQPQYQAPQYQQPQQMNPAAAQELARYQQMLQSGVISKEEYNSMCARLMGR